MKKRTKRIISRVLLSVPLLVAASFLVIAFLQLGSPGILTLLGAVAMFLCVYYGAKLHVDSEDEKLSLWEALRPGKDETK